jgi:6-phosphogluconolactonase
VLNSAAEIIFLITGRSKAAILRDLLERKSDGLPAGKIRPHHGALRWLVDREAAGLLREAPGAS